MVYQIKVKGLLDKSWSAWLGSVKINSAAQEDGSMITTMTVDVIDQPVLFGILDRIRDLNLSLISVKEMDGKEL